MNLEVSFWFKKGKILEGLKFLIALKKYFRDKILNNVNFRNKVSLKFFYLNLIIYSIWKS